MRFRGISSIAMAALGFGCLMVSNGRRESSAATEAVAINHVTETELMLQDQPPPWVTVDWSLTLDADTQALYQRMATLVGGFIDVPPDRATYFADFIGNIGSWGGMVNSVQGDGCGGYMVTVSVDGLIDQGQLDNDNTGTVPSTIFALYSEIYHVDAMGNLTYVGASIPAGAPTQVSFTGAP